MNEGHLPFSDREDDQQDCVQRYEDMLSRNDLCFFDVEEFELIIDHYLDGSEPRKAQQVLVFAHRQHPGSVNLLFCEANIMLGMGKLNRALEVLDAIEKLEPFNEEVHLQKAGIFGQLRNYRKAIDHYRKAIGLADEGLDDIYLDLAFEHENCEEFDEAIGCLQKALELNPENEAVLYELAYCYDLAGADAASIAFFRRFTNDNPYSFVAWYNLGNALAREERSEEALDALDYAIAIDERFSSAYFSKARVLLQLGRYAEAVECYRETLAFDGPQAITFSYIGECFEKMEAYDQALIHYDKALALEPEWVDAWVGRGVVKDVQGRVSEAVSDLEQAVRLAPEHADAWYYLANALARRTDYAPALAAYTRCNTIDPSYLDGWLDHADLLLQIKGPESALAKLREAEIVHKLNARFRYRHVSYLLRAGRTQRALLELEEALMVDHSAHQELLTHYPEAANMPQVVHLLDLYRR
ncbi:MAG: tetratricopeptide repeat protein [Flavobacteriales bacterium]|nr:tetratricopeptide repeat protein [Flavobacteriales bacterium]MCB0784347.1 tetratricopeptide repeat protein [Flavobacteriales bacterium]MCB0809427.1 tetratricopeptide repeat protein [Flavobacteriales bacterium]MCB0812448.1 tetratricopeptide repeat protein [Flavobacteriales bacterium]MCB0816501.1 tetratricopeptide repeat protein [Flavobacteriales bacterium]